MTVPCKIVLHSLTGYRPELDALVVEWMATGVKYIGVIGVDASRLEEQIDELCVGDGADPYFMLTASHGAGESVEEALHLASLVSEVDGVALDDLVAVVRF